MAAAVDLVAADAAALAAAVAGLAAADHVAAVAAVVRLKTALARTPRDLEGWWLQLFRRCLHAPSVSSFSVKETHRLPELGKLICFIFGQVLSTFLSLFAFLFPTGALSSDLSALDFSVGGNLGIFGAVFDEFGGSCVSSFCDE